MKLINFLRLKYNLTKKDTIKYLNNKEILINNEKCFDLEIELKENDMIIIDGLNFKYNEHLYLLIELMNFIHQF